MDIAIVGATGNVGRKTLEVLQQKNLILIISIWLHHQTALETIRIQWKKVFNRKSRNL